MIVYKNGVKIYEFNAQELQALITSLQANLQNNYITKEQTANLIASARSLYQVDTLPANPERNTMYYVGTTSPYHVYLYDSNGNQVDMGESEVNLSNYYTKTEVNTLLDNKHVYQHIFGIRYENFPNFYGMFYIFTANNTPFTYDTLAKWLFDNGLTGENAQYPINSGSDDFIRKYASSNSGGSNTSQFTATGPIIGLCSTDGSTIQYYYNRTSRRNLSGTQGTGTWIQNVSILRIL